MCKCGPVPNVTTRAKTQTLRWGWHKTSPTAAHARIRIWPVHPLLLLALFPLLPTWCYLNRGYTVWYHLIAVFYLLTNVEFLRRFLMVQGVGICLGWYASIVHDLYHHSRFCHILYMNMPLAMKNYMVDDYGKVLDTNTTQSLATMCLSHAVDTLLHPGIVYFLWKAHTASRVVPFPKRNNGNILTWPVIFSTLLTSRLWSVVHVYHNTGQFGLFYVGHDIYHVHDLDAWLPAYVAEGLFYLLLVLYKWKNTYRGSEEKSVSRATCLLQR